MNILFVACSSHLYGANQSLLNMLSICDKYNCFVVLPNDGPLANKIKSMGISCKIIRYNCASHYNLLGYWMHFFYFSILNVCAVYEVVRFILAHKVDRFSMPFSRQEELLYKPLPLLLMNSYSLKEASIYLSADGEFR